jgi:hypothetical protein
MSEYQTLTNNMCLYFAYQDTFYSPEGVEESKMLQVKTRFNRWREEEVLLILLPEMLPAEPLTFFYFVPL